VELTTDSSWVVNPDATEEAAYVALASDRIWNAFAIADLEPPFRAFSRIALARRAGADPSACCLFVESPALNVAVPHGYAAGIAAILSTVAVPTCTSFQIRADHVPPVAHRYDFVSERRVLVRMAIDASGFRPAASSPGLVRLSPSDLDDLLDLYAGYPENHFSAIQLKHGVYFGVRDGPKLLAAGGTHVVCARYGIAVLGGIYTHPAVRGRGYASAVTSALVGQLFDIGCRDVTLNVGASNETARHIYQRLGFRDHCQYEAVEAVLRRLTNATRR
jgi:GNAT superfamily N-acetyltransferase